MPYLFWVLPQKVAADFFGAKQSALSQVMGYRNKLARQVANPLLLRQCDLRVCGSPHFSKQLCLFAPASLQCRIEARRFNIGIKSRNLLSHRRRKVPLLLPSTTIFGHDRVKLEQMRLRRVEPLEIARSDCRDIVSITVPLITGEHSFR